MGSIISDRMADVPRSFIREILKVTADASIISLAGGLPNRNLFPIEPIKKAIDWVMTHDAADALQYSTTEGYAPLRDWIVKRYAKTEGLNIDPNHILITNGSQQALDLIGKVLVNEGDSVIIEEPGYLGAIQAFSMYRPEFVSVPLNLDGIDMDRINDALMYKNIKLMYGVPNFQNPSGISYSEEKRHELAAALKKTGVLFVEDDPYGALRFEGTPKTSLYKLYPGKTIRLGSFSKVFVPSMRLGWLASPPELYEKFVVAKQAADLHTNYFGQRVVYQYLTDNDLDKHIATIVTVYGTQCKAMISAIERYFPPSVTISHPEGGMFLWAILPKNISSLDVFEKAIRAGVAFVPGDPFYVGKTGSNTMRLNFSCVDPDTIEKGIKILGSLLHTFTKG